MRYMIDYVVALEAMTGFAGSNVQSTRNYSLVIARGNVHLTNREQQVLMLLPLLLLLKLQLLKLFLK